MDFFSGNSEEWNDFVLRNGGSFLQSFEWGEFQKSLGRKIWRLKNDNFQALVIKHNLPFKKSYLYCSRGPILANSKSQMANSLRIFLEEIKKIVKQEKTIFLRVDPEWGIEDKDTLKDFGFRKSFKEIQPKRTLILDLTKTGEELLAQMHEKTRYNIRLAERHGIKILKSKTYNLRQLEKFWELMEKTAKRDKFRPHPKIYYQKMLEILQQTTAELFLAEYGGKIIAANIVVFFGKRATYLHGASDFNYRNLMAPYLLHWHQILEAKNRGCVEYDFWGIDGKKWPGITRFKRGFGGKEIEYIGAYDFALDKKLYFFYKNSNRFTKILNRLL